MATKKTQLHHVDNPIVIVTYGFSCFCLSLLVAASVTGSLPISKDWSSVIEELELKCMNFNHNNQLLLTLFLIVKL